MDKGGGRSRRGAEIVPLLGQSEFPADADIGCGEDGGKNGKWGFGTKRCEG